MEQVRTWVLTAGAVVLALLILATLVRAVLGPRFTDRIVAVNVISTLVIAELVLLAAGGLSGGCGPGVRAAELSGGGGGLPSGGGPAAETPGAGEDGRKRP